MRDENNIQQFQKDRRVRTRIVATEAISRTQRGDRSDRPERRSFNPNFSTDNKFIGGPKTDRATDRPDRPERGERGERNFDRPERNFERSDRPYGERKFGDKKTFGDRKSFDRNKKPFVKRGSGAMDAGAKPATYPTYNATETTDKELRLNRFISMSGKCSRREADELIAKGEVTVNGVVVTEMGVKVTLKDEIKLRGEVLSGEKKVYILMNKPKGYVTSLDDPHADKTVMDIVRNACTERIYPVGRLDKNSVGVLLLTNDGDLTERLTHPSQEKRKVYQVTLERPLTNNDLLRARDGIDLEDGVIIPDAVEFVKPDSRTEVGIEIHSGRNRIVRRIFEEMGYGVHKLDRVYFAGLTKKKLKRGQWRFLTNAEVSMLKSGRYE